MQEAQIKCHAAAQLTEQCPYLGGVYTFCFSCLPEQRVHGLIGLRIFKVAQTIFSYYLGGRTTRDEVRAGNCPGGHRSGSGICLFAKSSGARVIRSAG